jgi:hypothetical protein
LPEPLFRQKNEGQKNEERKKHQSSFPPSSFPDLSVIHFSVKRFAMGRPRNSNLIDDVQRLLDLQEQVATCEREISDIKSRIRKVKGPAPEAEPEKA